MRINLNLMFYDFDVCPGDHDSPAIIELYLNDPYVRLGFDLLELRGANLQPSPIF